MVPPIEPRPPVSPLSRVFFFAAGLIALGVGIIITLGAALAGVLSIGAVALVLRRRNRRMTRRLAWVVSVGGTVAVLFLLTGIAVLADDSTRRPLTAAERAERRAQATQTLPDWLRAANPSAQRQSAVADSMAERLLGNRAVVVWAGIMGAVIASSLIGAIAGSFAWGGVMLLYRGLEGDWMPQSAPT